MHVRTLGGDVDVVADKSLLKLAPKKGGMISGQFWLSARLINSPKNNIKNIEVKKKGIFQRLFSRNKK